MAKLLPPYIEGGLAAQMGDGIAIPFRLNKAVSIYQVRKMYARIKTVATDKWLATLETDSFSMSETDGTYVASFALGDELTLNPGQCYKVQLAFGDGQIQGYFSTVGVFKYTTKPNIYIEGLANFETGNLYTYIGVYDQTGGDITEKVYNYLFEVYKGTTLIASSGLCLHDSSNDIDPAKSSDKWVLNQQLQHGVTYQIRYTAYTINGITAVCQYNILNNEIDDITLNEAYRIEAVNNYDNGCVQVNLITENPTTLNGGFVVSRASSKDNYETWYDEKNANLMNAVAEVRGETVSGVPYIVVGNQSWNGFDESIGNEILDKIKAEYKAEERYDVMDYVDESVLIKEPAKDDSIADDIAVTVLLLVVVAGVGLGIYTLRKSN